MEKLYPEQQNHFKRLEEILSTTVFAGDFSVMGAGKTYTTCALAYHFNLPMLVLAPRATLEYWQDVANEMEVEIIAAISYESLRSTKGHQVKHGFLVRYDYNDGSVDFAPSDKIKEVIDAGVLIVADECQKVKNNTAQAKAFRALISYLTDNGGISRVIFLSGTPFEDYDHAVNFFRMIGFIRRSKLYTFNKNKEFIPLGISELIEAMTNLYPEEIGELVDKYLPFNRSNIREFVFEVFSKIIVPNYTSAMPSPILDYQKNVANGYYPLQKKEEEELKEAIFRLQKASCYRPETGTVSYNDMKMGEITKALWQVENKKIPIFLREARKILEEKPNAQVVIFVNYRETVQQLAEGLSDFSPLIFDGQVRNIKEESLIIREFQENKTRLLIANIRKGSLGISLHDTIGERPRYTFISPTFSITDMHQASNRTYRQGLKSNAYIRIVYGLIQDENERVLEKRILNALAKKTVNLKKILVTQTKEGVLFPGDYPEEINI